jgi:hypothetical protein
MSGAWAKVTQTASDAWTGLKEGLSESLSEESKAQIRGAISAVKEKWNDVINSVSGLWNSAVSKISEGWNSIIKKFEPIVGWVKDKFSPIFNIVSGISNAVKGLWEKISSLSVGDIFKLIGKGTGKLINFAIGGGEKHSNGGAVGGNITNAGNTIMNMSTESHSVGGAVGGNITNAGDTIMTVSNNTTEKHSSGGSVGRITKPEGEDILTWLKKGEIVLNEKQQKMFTDNIQAMPVGQKEYIYVPQNTSTSNVGNNKVTVDAIKVNVGGTIRIDMGGGNTRELDSRAYDIIAQKVSEYFTNQFNLKAVNDTAYVSGAFMPTSLYGKMKTTT